jgi:iron(III) transport system permease protein
MSESRTFGGPLAVGFLSNRDFGPLGISLLVAVFAILVLPPVGYLLKTSFLVEQHGAAHVGWANYRDVLALNRWTLWKTSLLYAAGSSLLSILLGVTSAWLVSRTNAWGRRAVVVSAFLSLSMPVIVKAIGWILLLGPNKGLINELLRQAFGISGTPIRLFSLGGMIVIEAILWAPVVLLLMLPAWSNMNSALEEAAATSGASRRQTFFRITLPLAAPSILSVLLLTLVRALESFEVPLLIGTPGRLATFTTEIYDAMHRSFIPSYGEASAYAVCLVLIVSVPLLLSNRATRSSEKFATVTGKSFRAARIDLGPWRYAAGAYLALMPLALAAPLLILLWASFLPFYGSASLSDIPKMSMANYLGILSEPETFAGLRNSFVVATISAAAVAGLTFLAAWILVRRRERSRWLLEAIGSFPLVFPGVVLATALLVEFLGLRFIPLYDTIWLLVVGFVVRFLPYGMRLSQAGLRGLQQALEEAARTSGSSFVTTLLRVVLPLSAPAVVSVWLYVFLNSIRDLSLPVILSGPQNPLISIVVLDFWHDGKIPTVGAISVILAVVATAFGLAFMKLTTSFSSRN